MADCVTGILVDLNEEKKSAVHRPELTLPPLTFDADVCRTPEPDPKKERNIANVDDLMNEDVKLIDAEEFNFDLLMSPCSSEQPEDEDEDADEEVFFGPVQGFSEICAAACAKTRFDSEQDVKPMSPLNPKQVAELFKEAHTLAFHIENSRTDSPDTKVDDLTRKFRKARITAQPTTTTTTVVSPPVKSPSADSGLADTSASSHEDRSETDQPRFALDFKTPEKIVRLGSREAETRIDRISYPKSDLLKSNTGVVKFRSRNEKGLEGLKCSKVSRTGLRVPTSSNLPKSGSLPKPGRLVRGGSFRQKPVTSPLKRQRKNSLGSDIETASIGSDRSDSMSSLTGVPLTGKRALLPPRQQRSTAQRQSGLRLPQPRTRTLSSSSAGSCCSTSSQVSNCSQTSSASLSSLHAPKTKLQLKPTSGMKVPAKTQERRPVGPVKARPPSPGRAGTKPTVRGGAPEKENKPSAMKPPDARVPRRGVVSSSSGSSVGSTPTPTPHKPEKHVQPKRLLSAGEPCTPKKESLTGPPTTPKSNVISNSATKRRSFLPTPSSLLRKVAAKPSPLSTRMGNTGSLGTDGSPVLANARPVNLRVRAGLLTTPDVTKPSRSRVLHTPLHDTASKPPRAPSRWTPVRKNKPLNKDDEYIQCTKRGQAT